MKKLTLSLLILIQIKIFMGAQDTSSDFLKTINNARSPISVTPLTVSPATPNEQSPMSHVNGSSTPNTEGQTLFTMYMDGVDIFLAELEESTHKHLKELDNLFRIKKTNNASTQTDLNTQEPSPLMRSPRGSTQSFNEILIATLLERLQSLEKRLETLEKTPTQTKPTPENFLIKSRKKLALSGAFVATLYLCGFFSSSPSTRGT